jgi:hypothetical protein
MQNSFHPTITINGERIIHRNVALTCQYALLTGWCIIALRDIHCYYLREICRDVFRGSFERIGMPDAAKAMDYKYNCQILDFVRKQ